MIGQICPECGKRVYHGSTRHRVCQGLHIGEATKKRNHIKKILKVRHAPFGKPLLRGEIMKAWLLEVETPC